MSELEDIRVAKSKLKKQILGVDGISGIGIGPSESGEYILRVNMIDDSVDTNVLPKSIDGFDVVYTVVGVIKAR